MTLGHCEKEIFIFFCASGRRKGQLVCLLCKSSSRLEKLFVEGFGWVILLLTHVRKKNVTTNRCLLILFFCFLEKMECSKCGKYVSKNK